MALKMMMNVMALTIVVENNLVNYWAPIDFCEKTYDNEGSIESEKCWSHDEYANQYKTQTSFPYIALIPPYLGSVNAFTPSHSTKLPLTTRY